MAQTMQCDLEGHAHPADMIVTDLTDGQTIALCGGGYIELCQAVAAQAETAWQAEQARQAESPEAAEAADQAEADATDQDAADRLAGVGPVGSIIAGIEAADEARIAAGLVEAPEPDPTPAHTVRRGTSRSRKAHEARQRARKTEPDPEASPEPDGAPGPNLAGSGDPGGSADA